MSKKRTAKPREKKPRPDPNEPFRLGFDAGRAGRPLIENPYYLSVSLTDSQKWHDGWQKGRALYDAVQRANDARYDIAISLREEEL